ncbi:hypothetical protein SAMN05216343_103142 [Oscillibacter sp. PC13]|uniref:hypothetical protein n=1 Tax=Oscillibacter sp. PC13 TaxID=1855299 RepID=UPI0008EDBFC4|nr:hypothetical protein [Oscillibacter sp. PC13]SFP13515.1 hypothetical protein SAMN05216343_103142 [Oscillibacter sp. PC13]
MTAYANRNECSGILAYDVGETYIKVLFANGSVYLYSDVSTGHENVACMKALAERGYGLNTFINRYVKDAYALYTHLPAQTELDG